MLLAKTGFLHSTFLFSYSFSISIRHVSNLMSLICYFILNNSTGFRHSLPIIRSSYTAWSAIVYGKRMCGRAVWCPVVEPKTMNLKLSSNTSPITWRHVLQDFVSITAVRTSNLNSH
jgi:hypothetical protein